MGALDWNRTNDLLLRRQTLYPLSYEGNQGSCSYRRDVLELSRKVGLKGKSTENYPPSGPAGLKASRAGKPRPCQSNKVRLLWALPLAAPAPTPGSQPGSQMK